METGGKARTLGLVSGLGVGAGIFYYKSLVGALLARGVSARLLMVHADGRHVMSQAAARHTMALAEYDAIILAGTDLALAFNATNTDFPHLDGARVHLQSIVDVIAPSPEVSAVQGVV